MTFVWGGNCLFISEKTLTDVYTDNQTGPAFQSASMSIEAFQLDLNGQEVRSRVFTETIVDFFQIHNNCELIKV